ncbi:MAG TPA: hypothetical protein VKY92_12995 [Verrucomicrobiae bacterium]|nr:hypothetical protein [Verrucomicrobiae bacterium]
MSTILICPAERKPVAALAKRMPLVTVPVLGQSLLEYWLSALAIRGARDVLVLAHDRAELASEVVGQGQRWGLSVRVIAESRELTPAEALLKYGAQIDPALSQESIVVLDHLPGKPEHPLFSGFDHFFAGVRGWMRSALTPDRVGICEIAADVWTGCHSHISPGAKLKAPCWIGQHVYVGAGAIVGPGAVVENGSFIEPGAELAESWVGSDTFVGRFARIAGSLAWGSTLVDWRIGSAAELADPFLLCALRKPRRAHSPGWFTRLSEVYNRNKGEVSVLWKHLLLHKEG